jgi:hypothetical protein
MFIINIVILGPSCTPTTYREKGNIIITVVSSSVRQEKYFHADLNWDSERNNSMCKVPYITGMTYKQQFFPE